MAWIKLGNLKGPVGETGPRGPAASTAQTFLAAHPVGSLYMESKGKTPVPPMGERGPCETARTALYGKGRLKWRL